MCRDWPYPGKEKRVNGRPYQRSPDAHRVCHCCACYPFLHPRPNERQRAMGYEVEIPPELNRALIAFNNDLARWLDAGGDDRLLDFDPLETWHSVVKLLAVRHIQ